MNMRTMFLASLIFSGCRLCATTRLQAPNGSIRLDVNIGRFLEQFLK